MQDKLKKLIGQQVDVLVMGDGFQVNLFDKLVFHPNANCFSVGDFCDKYISFMGDKVTSIVNLDDESGVGIVIRP
jgi:hypothetical protein